MIQSLHQSSIGCLNYLNSKTWSTPSSVGVVNGLKSNHTAYAILLVIYVIRYSYILV